MNSKNSTLAQKFHTLSKILRELKKFYAGSKIPHSVKNSTLTQKILRSAKKILRELKKFYAGSKNSTWAQKILRELNKILHSVKKFYVSSTKFYAGSRKTRAEKPNFLFFSTPRQEKKR